MIKIRRAQAEDLEAIIAIQRAAFKAVYEKYQDEYDPYLEDESRIRWKLIERPNSFYYLITDGEDVCGFIRVQTNDDQSECWLGTAAILPEYQGQGIGSAALKLVEEALPMAKQWDLCTVLQDEGMVHFYEKNGYQPTHTKPEQEGMDMVYMTKKIDN